MRAGDQPSTIAGLCAAMSGRGSGAAAHFTTVRFHQLCSFSAQGRTMHRANSLFNSSLTNLELRPTQFASANTCGSPRLAMATRAKDARRMGHRFKTRVPAPVNRSLDDHKGSRWLSN